MGEPAPPDTGQPEELALEVRKDITRLRAVLYEPAHVRLSTSAMDAGRWLTDGYVLLDVTDAPAAAGVPDGRFKLTAGKGFAAIDGANEFDPDGYFGALAGARWAAATPSEWSVAEHPGKAMLFAIAGIAPFARRPALMGESTWTALRKHYPDAAAEYLTAGPDLNIFRILTGGGAVAAYVAGIRIPEGQEDIAAAIAQMTPAGSGPRRTGEGLPGSVAA